MATRNPSLGLTHHIYNRLQAGCYLTIDLNFKDHKKLSGKTSKNSLTHTHLFVGKQPPFYSLFVHVLRGSYAPCSCLLITIRFPLIYSTTSSAKYIRVRSETLQKGKCFLSLNRLRKSFLIPNRSSSSCSVKISFNGFSWSVCMYFLRYDE